MAVQLNTGSYRADYLAGEAASQRTEVHQAQGSQFAQMLGSHDTGKNKSSGYVPVKNSVVDSGLNTNLNSNSGSSAGSAVNAGSASVDRAVYRDSVIAEKIVEAVESVKISEAQGIIEKDAAEIPEDTMELAKAIIDGNVKLEDVPKEKITFELLKALVIMRYRKKLEEDQKANDPNEKSRDQLSASAVVDAQLAVLYKLIDAYTETRYDDGDATAFMKRIDEVCSMLDEQKNEADLTDMLAQIIDESISAGESANQAAELDEGEDYLDKLIEQLSEAVGDETAKALEDAVRSGDISEIKKAVTQIVSELAKPEVIEAKPQSNIQKAVSEELEMLKNAKLRAQQAAKAAAESEDEVIKITAEAQGADDKQDSGAGLDRGQQGAAMAANEAPVIFRTADGAEFEVQPSEVVSQAMKLVEQAIDNAQTETQTEYSLVLNPGELGRITVKMIKAADGAVSVTIAAENAHTQRILEENSSLMQSNLRSNGIQLENWQTVSESQQETLAQDYNGSSKNPYYREDSEPQEEPEGAETFAEIIAAM